MRKITSNNSSLSLNPSWSGTLAVCGAAWSALWLCSCTSPLSTAASDPFLDNPAASRPLHAPAVNKQSEAGRVKLAANPPATPSNAARSAADPLAKTHAAGDRGARNATGSDFQLVSHEEAAQNTLAPNSRGVSAAAVSFSPADPRNDLPSPSYGAQGVKTVAHEQTTFVPGLPDFPDEYLLDGGDRRLPLHREQTGYSGLDTEDTVADYVDSQGKRRMLPSNRVAIYAPRFAAVRTVSGPETGVTVDRLASTDEFTRSEGMRSRTSPTNHAQREASGGVKVRSRASGLEAPSISEGLGQTTYATEHVKLLNAFQDLRFIKGGELLQSEEARLSLGIQNALVWNRELYPVAMASIDAVGEVVARFKPSELVGVEDRSKPGRLRIVKLADRDTALPGEIVTFTIRYDNLGDHELKELQIIDNLTPRLEYVKDSATSDRDGRLDVTDNGEGSSVLTLKLKGTLPGKEGGVLTFKARIR